MVCRDEVKKGGSKGRKEMLMDAQMSLAEPCILKAITVQMQLPMEVGCQSIKNEREHSHTS